MAGPSYTLVFTSKQGSTSRIINIESEAKAHGKWAKLKNSDNPPVSGHIEAPDGTQTPLD